MPFNYAPVSQSKFKTQVIGRKTGAWVLLCANRINSIFRLTPAAPSATFQGTGYRSPGIIMARPTSATCQPSDIRCGDLLAFGPSDALGGIISLGTVPPWPFSLRVCHVGIVGYYLGETAVYESISDPELGDCLHAGCTVTGVQVHQARKRILRHVADRRSRMWRLPLAPMAFSRIKEANSLVSGDDLISSAAQRFLGWGDVDASKLLFCSEFVLTIYATLGLLPVGFEPSKYSPKLAVRAARRMEICGPPQEILL